jgi:hypothetical protein
MLIRSIRKIISKKENYFNKEKNIKVKIILYFNLKGQFQLIDRVPSEAGSYQA